MWPNHPAAKDRELSLTHFEFRVFLANDVHTAFAAHDFAVFAAFFDGCSNFHRV